MADFESARGSMVDNQLRTSGITDRRILAAMHAVPRELFVAPERQSVAYIDDVQWLGNTGRFISSPATFAKLVQLAEIEPTDTVLDIGPASGYSTAVLARIASSVVGVESDAELAAVASQNFSGLSIANARIVAGNVGQLGKIGFDVIVVEGALDAVPQAFFALLNDGGRLVALIRGSGVAVANVFVKTGQAIAARAEFNATLPPLFAAPSTVEFVF